MTFRECSFQQAPEILAIFNDAILNSTALYDYKERTMAQMATWFEAKQKGRLPVIGAFDDTGALCGFASYGSFRPHPAYKYSVEHSIYVRKDCRGQGLGKRLLKDIIAAAINQEYHMMIGVIDSMNEASIRLHQQFGFVSCGLVRHAGYKFGRWLDVELYQLLLPTPSSPDEES